MRIFNWLVVGLLLALLISSGPVSACTYTYDDIYTEWPGYETALNSEDSYGNPDILSMTVVTDSSGYLDSITIAFDTDCGFGLSNVGDYNGLYINKQKQSTEQYDNWDFYFSIQNNGDFFPEVSGYDLSSEDWSYTYANEEKQRIGHPNGIDTTSMTADSDLWESFLWGVNGCGSELLLTLNFEEDEILLGDGFIIGYNQYCANDNFLTHAPVPGAFWLLGSGLVGLISCRRRRVG